MQRITGADFVASDGRFERKHNSTSICNEIELDDLL